MCSLVNMDAHTLIALAVAALLILLLIGLGVAALVQGWEKEETKPAQRQARLMQCNVPSQLYNHC